MTTPPGPARFRLPRPTRSWPASAQPTTDFPPLAPALQTFPTAPHIPARPIRVRRPHPALHAATRLRSTTHANPALPRSPRRPIPGQPSAAPRQPGTARPWPTTPPGPPPLGSGPSPVRLSNPPLADPGRLDSPAPPIARRSYSAHADFPAPVRPRHRRTALTDFPAPRSPALRASPRSDFPGHVSPTASRTDDRTAPAARRTRTPRTQSCPLPAASDFPRLPCPAPRPPQLQASPSHPRPTSLPCPPSRPPRADFPGLRLPHPRPTAHRYPARLSAQAAPTPLPSPRYPAQPQTDLPTPAFAALPFRPTRET